MNREAYYPHVAGCPSCGHSGLCPIGAALASEMLWLKCRRGFWKDSTVRPRADISGTLHTRSNAMPGQGVNPGTFLDERFHDQLRARFDGCL